MTTTIKANVSSIQLSDKVNRIKELPNIDNKDTVVQEIEALEIFTPEERASIFGNSNILWILKSFTIVELKDRALKALKKPEVHVGDVVRFGNPVVSGIVLEVVGEGKDRLSIMYKEVSEYNNIYSFVEGVSIYNVTLTGSSVNTDFLNAL